MSAHTPPGSSLQEVLILSFSFAHVTAPHMMPNSLLIKQNSFKFNTSPSLNFVTIFCFSVYCFPLAPGYRGHVQTLPHTPSLKFLAVRAQPSQKISHYDIHVWTAAAECFVVKMALKFPNFWIGLKNLVTWAHIVWGMFWVEYNWSVIYAYIYCDVLALIALIFSFWYNAPPPSVGMQTRILMLASDPVPKFFLRVFSDVTTRGKFISCLCSCALYFLYKLIEHLCGAGEIRQTEFFR